MELELAVDETYPGTRENSTPPANSMVIKDVQHMAAFFYDFYLKKVNSMKDQIQVHYFYFNFFTIYKLDSGPVRHPRRNERNCP